MPSNTHSSREIELAVLRTLLLDSSMQGAIEDVATREALEQLSSYNWLDQEHRLVYDCLRVSRRNAAVPLRLQMAAEATRMGHPEIDWSLYFQPPPGSSDLNSLLRALRKFDTLAL